MAAPEPARVLVVDDHELNLKLLRMALELDGHDVVAVGCLRAAERVLEREAVSLIVLDLQLPDGDGLDLARRVNAGELGDTCAIVACTAGAMKEHEERCLAAGCAAYVAKPIDVGSFGGLVADLLAREPGRC